MPTDLSPAVIDATDATVLPPEQSPAFLTERQTEELEKCEFHLNRLGPRIAARENDLIYLYLEAGCWLMRAQEVHRVCHDDKHGDTGRFVEAKQPRNDGFVGWLEKQDLSVSQRTAYRYIEGARNCGLTPESTVLTIQTYREEKRYHGKTLADVCRKPVDKSDRQAQLHDVSPDEQQQDDLKDITEAYRLSAQFLAEQVIDQQTWALLPEAEKEAYGKYLSDAHRAYQAGLKKARTLPAPKAKATPLRAEEIPVDPPAPLSSVTAQAEALREQIDALDADPVYSQDEADRGLWWYGYRNPYGSFFAKTYRGNFEQIIEDRRDPRVIVVGPFYARGQAEAEKIVEQRCRGQKSRVEQHADQVEQP